MRKCKGKYYKDREYHDFDNGSFHCWGKTYEESDNGGCEYTVAIVELPDGQVVTVNPDDLVFLNKKEG